jgi:hypothetical protein
MKKTGGPAFPTGTAFQGMTLRDYFAAKAMQGFAADPEANWQDGSGLPGMARCAYQWADAMLEAREK